MSPADLADLRRQTTLTTNCLSLRDNAACCIRLRHLRDLRENTHARVLNLYCTNEPPTVAQQPFYESKKLFYSFTQHKSNFKVNYYQ